MTSSVENSLAEFLLSIEETEEFREYQDSLDVIVSNHEYKEFILNMKREQHRLGERIMTDLDVLDELNEKMRNDLITVLEHEALSRFLRAEVSFSDLLADVLSNLSNAMNSWFLDSVMYHKDLS